MSNLSVKSVTNRHGFVVTLEETGKGHIKVWGNGVTLAQEQTIELRDWLNERYPTQPAAGEPDQQTAINADDLPTKKYPLGAFDFAAPVAAGEPVATWVALTAAGQLRKGDKIRFRFGQETLTETVALVLEAGTEREEIVYNRKRNFYFITSKALAGTSSAKEVEVLRTVAAPPAAAHGNGFRAWLAAEMPAGTVICDPSWWAERILKRIGYAAHGEEAVRKDWEKGRAAIRSALPNVPGDLLDHGLAAALHAMNGDANE